MCKEAHSKNFVAKVKEKKRTEEEYLNLTNAYEYLIDQKYGDVVSKIKNSKNTYKGDLSRARRAKIVALLGIVDLLYDGDCIKKYWSTKVDSEARRKKLNEYSHRFLEMMEQRQTENQ